MQKQNKIKSNNVTKVVQKNLKQTGSMELRKRLPRGAVQEIANELSLSWMWTFNVISGKAKGDPSIVFMALEYAKLEDERRERLSSMIERNKKELQKIC